MSTPSTTEEFLALVAKSELLPALRLEEFIERRRGDLSLPDTPMKTAQYLVFDGLLTKYQAEQLLSGRWRNFVIGGKYKLLEKLGNGGMALVFLCEHQVMKRLVALKILPTAHGEDKELLGRFHREARALSSLRHPNIVGAYDADHANKVHFLVMEYIDGGDLDQILQRVGPLGWERAAHYISQAADGLQHAHERGLVHRDIKPGNLLVDRSGVVKLLDLGLARIFHETTDDLTTGRDAKTLLGTVDYLAPEQALNSHEVDIRADIYGLGATFYFILTGKGLFEDGTVAQKLSWHLHRPPVEITSLRQDVPDGLIRVIDKMLAKRPEDRYQTPHEVVEALEPWTSTPIAPPDPIEFPQLSRAARGIGSSSISRSAPFSVRMPLSSAPKPSSHLSKSTKIIHEGVSPELGSMPPKPTLPSTLNDIPLLPKGESGLERPATVPGSGRQKPMMIVATAAGLLILSGVALWTLFGPTGGASVASKPEDIKTTKVAVVTRDHSDIGQGPPADQAADASVTLTSGSAQSNPFPSLREAIKAAKPGDKLVVTGTLLVDSIEVSDVEGVPKDLTIEGVNPRSKGALVRWRAPRDLGSGRALLDASGLEGFQLKGFLFDGQARVAELIRLSGRGVGSTLEGLQIQGATRAGIVLKGWAGESSRPSTIRDVRFSTSNGSEAAIAFDSDADRPNVSSQSIRVVSCRFVGPFESALLIDSPVQSLEIEQCRFFRATDALRYRRGGARYPLRVRLANNTFSELQRGLHFETTPPSASSELVVANNIFSNTTRAATLDRVSVEPGRIAARWIWIEDGKKTPTVAPGVRQFRKSFELAILPSKANLDISCDETFVVWLNGVELMRNPSPHFTQRVFALEVARHLRPGKNVLAVEGTNRLDRLDPKFGTTAGLLAQITTLDAGREVVLVKTDETWKGEELAPQGWNLPDFDDHTWPSARRWQDDGTTWPWKYAVWDSSIGAQLKPPLEPIQVLSSGNVRDYKSWEGYPTLDSERVVIQEAELPKDPGDDPSFLHYPVQHPLSSAGPGGVPLGAFIER